MRRILIKKRTTSKLFFLNKTHNIYRDDIYRDKY